MKYSYCFLFLFLLSSCQSAKFCQQTEKVLSNQLDKNYWIVERTTPTTILVSAKKNFELLIYYPKFKAFRNPYSNEKTPITGFDYRTFEAPYKLELIFKSKGYSQEKHHKKESIRIANYLKDNPKSMMQARTLFFYQHIPIVLTSQFDDGGSINGMQQLEKTSESAQQVNSLATILYQHFNTPSELQAYFSENSFQEMPKEYLEGILTGKYAVDSTGGLIPSWGR